MYASLPVMIGGFLVGVLGRSLVAIDLAAVAALVFGAAALHVVIQHSSFHLSLYVVLAVCAMALGIVRTELALVSYEEHRVLADGTPLTGVGTVVAEPDVRDGYTILVVDTVPVFHGETVRLRMKVPPYPRVAYGDGVSVRGTVHVPQSFESDTGRTFNYPGYLMKDGIHYELRDAVVHVNGPWEGNRIVSSLLSLKHRWLAAVSLLMPEPNASLAGGVIVGAKRSLGDAWLDAFRVTGIIHIVVLSGYNLTLVAQSIVRASAALPRAVALGFGTLGVAAFALMTGAGATVVRASVMAVLGMLAVFLNRPYAILRALGVAAFLMVLWNPFTLVFDPGFQLSFVATLGLVLGAPVVERYLTYIPTIGGFRGIVAATFATQLAVLPLLMYQMGVVSLVAPVVNVLVLRLVPLLMATGFAAGIVGMVSHTLALPLAWVTNFLLSYTFTVVDVFHQLPFAAVNLPVLPVWSLIGLYLVLALGYHTLTRNTTRTEAGGEEDRRVATS